MWCVSSCAAHRQHASSNVCLIKICSKHSSNTFLSLPLIFYEADVRFYVSRTTVLLPWSSNLTLRILTLNPYHSLHVCSQNLFLEPLLIKQLAKETLISKDYFWLIHSFTYYVLTQINVTTYTIGYWSQTRLKYGSEEKGSWFYKCAILLGFVMSKKQDRLLSELLPEDKITNLLGFLT